MNLRFPSINYLLSQAKAAFLRFPLSLLSATVAVILAVYLIDTETEQFNRFPYINAMLCAALGIPLYFCIALFSARQQYNKRTKIITQLMGTAVLLAIYLSLPDAEDTHNTTLPYIRYGIYNIIVHLLVAFAPFLYSRQLNGFWNYNKSLFLRILLALLYSGFLYAGLMLALLALRLLFEIKFEEELFAELFVVIFGLFNTWFFVAGVPSDFEELEHNTDYPRGLKIFAQYVLLPLLLLYLVILYGYGFKIVFSWNWPKGIVSYLIMCVSVLGILTLLLIYPYTKQAEDRWIKGVSKAYYLLLLPLLVLLFLAIGMRLSDYGVTINRYIIVAVGVWLSLVCFYFLSGRENIKFVPASLAVMLLFVSIGPWSMFAVSERSQVKRLEAVLTSSGLLASDKLVGEVYWLKDSIPTFYSVQEKSNEGRLTDSLHNEVMSIMNYLDNHHGFDAIQPWYRQNLDSMIAIADADTSLSQWNRPDEARIYMESLGLSYEYKSKDHREWDYFTYSSNTNEALNIKGYDLAVFLGPIYLSDFRKDPEDFQRIVEANGLAYHLSSGLNDPGSITIITPDDTLLFDLMPRIKQIALKYQNEDRANIPANEMSLYLEKENKHYKLIIEYLDITKNTSSITLKRAGGILLIGELR